MSVMLDGDGCDFGFLGLRISKVEMFQSLQVLIFVRAALPEELLHTNSSAVLTNVAWLRALQ